MRPLAILLAAVTAVVGSAAAQSTPPATLPFQARLTLQSTGVDVNAFLQVTFRVYTTATGGTSLWTEVHPLVQVKNGLFKVELGSITAFPTGLFENGDLYIGVQVGGRDFDSGTVGTRRHLRKHAGNLPVQQQH